MALGQAAGTAASLAIETGYPLRAMNVDSLQRQLLKDGQVLTFFRDIDPKDPAHTAIQYFWDEGLLHVLRGEFTWKAREANSRRMGTPG
jgi:hypothetical protein